MILAANIVGNTSHKFVIIKSYSIDIFIRIFDQEQVNRP